MRNDLSSIVAHFAIPGEFLDAAPYGAGHIHDTFRVRSSPSSSFILQRINARVFTNPQAVMENIVRVTGHLRAKLAAVPGSDPSREALRMVPAKDGRMWFVDDNSSYWRMFDLIGGAVTHEVCESHGQAFEAARVVARFQSLLSDLPGERLRETIPFFHHTPRRLQALEDAVARDVANRCAGAQAEIEFALSRRDLANSVVHLLETGRIPERVTHNDTKLNNVLFDETTGRGLCIVDLDTCMPGSVLYDFGDMVRTMTSNAAEDEADLSRVFMDMQYFDALLLGYLDEARGFLCADEIGNLALSGRLMTFTVGVRFLTDHLAGDTYFKVHRPCHNLDRCRNQFKLVQSMEEQAAEMEAVVRKVDEASSLVAKRQDAASTQLKPTP
jgi:hypothetical protein